ncbi:hypothetical protein DW158_13845 [Parabacteroides merdae]|nr:hypothetical protein DW158_13845 [Parabacteroides merdae]RHL27303.1 hypothetical protein DW030_13445 [Parabacteroides merdae]RHM42185.1 hypothetical protein DWZ59_19660 [Parabacteroides merdae]RHN15397.1 hypothetical protein DWZ28_14805 [Parabacteroides merdae]
MKKLCFLWVERQRPSHNLSVRHCQMDGKEMDRCKYTLFKQKEKPVCFPFERKDLNRSKEVAKVYFALLEGEC